MKTRINFIFLAATLLATNSFAQDVAEVGNTKYTDLPPLFANTPKRLAKAKTLAELPKGTFLENIVVNSAGTLFVTSLFDGKILKIAPDGSLTTLVQLPGLVSGITLDQNENLVAVGAVGGKVPSVFEINANGTVTNTTTIEGGWLLNGIARLDGSTFLIADSYRDQIWEFNATTKQYGVWLANESLARTNVKGSIPGVNGLKRLGNTLYATNMDKAQLVKIPLLNNKPGKPEVFVSGLFADDFSIDAETGNLFVTTHAYNSVVVVTPQGQVTTLADKAEGMIGATSLAFGRDKANRRAVYVITNGGVLIPPAEGLQTAKVVRLAIEPKFTSRH